MAPGLFAASLFFIPPPPSQSNSPELKMINSTLDAEGAISAIGDLLADLTTSSDQEISDFGYPGSHDPLASDSVRLLCRSGWVRMPSGTTFRPRGSMNCTFKYMIKCTPIQRSSMQGQGPVGSDESRVPSGFTAMFLIGMFPISPGPSTLFEF